jgi:hypothetical protein
MKGKPILAGCLIVIVIVLLVPFVFWLFNAVWYNPSTLFEKKFGFKLPESVIIEKHQYDYTILLGEECFYMKAMFDQSDYVYFQNNLQAYFDKWGRQYSLNLIPYFTRGCPWWDVDVENSNILVDCNS